jgi:hypothetical protein
VDYLLLRFRRVLVSIVEMGVEEKMPPEGQHGGSSHLTARSCSTDLPAPSGTSPPTA